MKGGDQPADAAARARLATYAPGAVVFMGPDGAFNATEGRCVEFKRVAPPRGGRHVVVRFDWPFLSALPTDRCASCQRRSIISPSMRGYTLTSRAGADTVCGGSFILPTMLTYTTCLR